MPSYLVVIANGPGTPFPELSEEARSELEAHDFREVPAAQWTAAPEHRETSTAYRYEAKNPEQAIGDALLIVGTAYNRAVSVVGHDE